MANYCYLGDNNSDGTILGKTAASLVGFFAATPVAQQTAPSALGTTAVTSSSPYGYATTTQGNAVATAVNLITTALTNLGLVA